MATDTLPIVLDSLDSIDEQYRELYTKNDSGKFDFQTPDALLRSKNHEKTAKKEKMEELEAMAGRLKTIEDGITATNKAAQDKIDAAQLEAAKKSGDFDSIENSYKDKISNLIKEHSEAMSGQLSIINGLTVGQEASNMASKLFGENADVMKHHITGRLQSEVSDGKASIRVLDATGKPSALSLDELHDEFYNNTQFSSFIVGSKGSGGGANGSNSKNNSGSAVKKTIARADFLSLSESDRKTLQKEGVDLT